MSKFRKDKQQWVTKAEKIFSRLKHRAESGDFYENFGQKEVRLLDDKMSKDDSLSHQDRTSIRNNLSEKVMNITPIFKNYWEKKYHKTVQKASKQEIFDYLDKLKSSGLNNMLSGAATTRLQDNFDITFDTAREFLLEWIQLRKSKTAKRKKLKKSKKNVEDLKRGDVLADGSTIVMAVRRGSTVEFLSTNGEHRKTYVGDTVVLKS